MKNFIKNILLLGIIGILFYLFRFEVGDSFNIIKNRYFPCSSPIFYSIGIFDEQFGITKEDFIKALKEAELIWEPVDKELFVYKENGELKINLIYDSRQKATDILRKMGFNLEDNKASYDSLKRKYDILEAEYFKEKSLLESRVFNLQNRQNKYQQDVFYWNARGGASQTEYNRLEKEKNLINKEIDNINETQDILNIKINDVNALAMSLNKLVTSLNLNVQKFNEIGEKYSGEFEEGTYESDPSGARINIYQFKNREKLIRVLAHEFGHALQLDHISNPKAIMYWLNNGINTSITEDDLAELKRKCKL